MIAGPTASGKSALALALSRLTPATIINADASQVYRDLRIVSARPSPEEEDQAPHRLFGTIDGATAHSAAAWAADARLEVMAAQETARLPVLVGGTGLYLRTLLDGIAPVPDIDPVVRQNVRQMPVTDAYAALQSADPAASERLSANDSSRVARALEVVISTGKPLATWHAERTGGIGGQASVTAMVLLPPREWLFERCDRRFLTMLESGGIEEVRTLLNRQLDPALPVMRAIGVAQISQILADLGSREAAIAAAQLATRQYAKRQFTWFRNQPPADWERIVAQPDSDFVNKLAIKLRDRTLTS